jgi:hypothetical protein
LPIIQAKKINKESVSQHDNQSPERKSIHSRCSKFWVYQIHPTQLKGTGKKDPRSIEDRNYYISPVRLHIEILYAMNMESSRNIPL